MINRLNRLCKKNILNNILNNNKNGNKVINRFYCNLNTTNLKINNDNNNNNNNNLKESIREKIKDIPSLNEFLRNNNNNEINENNENKSKIETEEEYELPPYLSSLPNDKGNGRKVWIETYGCQMNVSDEEVICSIMKSSGYTISNDFNTADIVFLNTCSIRENAEAKIWLRLTELRAIRRKQGRPNLIVGVLGCMAERLKEKLLESDMKVDIVVGPDAYRSLPSLLATLEDGEQQTAINVILSADETYADIKPVRKSDNQVSAYVSIMRGCNNMCSYCIVPFTRGRERSRPIDSILREVKDLSDQGFKEITLLGQNVNSFNYYEESNNNNNDESLIDSQKNKLELESLKPREGFKTIYKSPKKGITFTKLMELVSKVDPEIRIRFTSPHPKDFPDDLLELIKNQPNICKQLHIPAQSGSSKVLESMRRGYTRESYIELIDTIKRVLPGCAISSDFISGFCGESDEDHNETISLMEYVGYENAFMFMYSLREKTHAHRQLKDDVPTILKNSRLTQVVDTFYKRLKEKNQLEIGNHHLVLVDGFSKRSEKDFVGRTDTNKKVLISNDIENQDDIKVGEYYIVEIIKGDSEVTLKGKPIMKSSIQHFNNIYNHKNKFI
ncbi:hypothetical protein ACTFIY_008421 [Dictyostelium cf. discoideum]